MVITPSLELTVIIIIIWTRAPKTPYFRWLKDFIAQLKLLLTG